MQKTYKGFTIKTEPSGTGAHAAHIYGRHGQWCKTIYTLNGPQAAQTAAEKQIFNATRKH